MAPTTTRLRRTSVAAAVPLGIVLSGLMVWQASHAAFTATTDNAGNSWQAGTVVLTNDAPTDTAMFEVTNLAPGDSDVRCITVTYTGNIAANVELYAVASEVTGLLAPHLDATVEIGTKSSPASAFGSCDGFTAAPTEPIFSGTLSGFPTAHGDFANGFGTWTPTGTGSDSRTYRFTTTLGTDTPNGLQGEDAEATFTWEAQST